MLKGKVAVVTGSSRGIGFEIAKELAENQGATVIVSSRNSSDAGRTRKNIKGDVYSKELDISSRNSVKEFVNHVVAKHGRIDILVNNAGYVFDEKIWYKRFHQITEEEFDRIFNVDLKGSIRMSRAVIPVMLKNKGGIIISISSTPALVGHNEGAPYSIAKAGIIAMTKHIALEYGKKNIKAYALALGNITTRATYGSMTEQEKKKAKEETSMKRWGKPEEVAKAVASLANNSFSFATGNTIIIDGGAVLL